MSFLSNSQGYQLGDMILHKYYRKEVDKVAVSNEFVFYKAGCTQNKENCIYPHKVVVTNAQEFNEMAKFDHVCAEYRGNYRGNSNFIWANTLPADSDNEGAADSSDYTGRHSSDVCRCSAHHFKK